MHACSSPGNNFTFGQGGKDEQGNVTEGWGYYETICGGSGAGPSWAGTSGVHVSSQVTLFLKRKTGHTNVS